MAAFKGLIEGECGATNPLINLSNIYTRDNTGVLQDGLVRPFSHDITDAHRSGEAVTTVDQFIQEYHRPLAAPTTFHLEGLLSRLQTSDQIRDQHGLEHEWSKDFLSPISHQATPTAGPTPAQNQFQGEWRRWNEPNFMSYPSTFLYNSPLQYADTPQMTTPEAQELLSYLKETEQATNIAFNTNNSKPVDETVVTSAIDTEDYSFSHITDTLMDISSWSQAAIDSSGLYSEYKFTENNPLLDHTNPFEEGLKRLQVHDIVNAVLFFEAAVQKQPDHVDAWLFLGITQAENEQDRFAICALKKCIELDPKNLRAYITLASCYANETMIDNAMDVLRQWLANHEKYSHLSPRQHLPKTTNDGMEFVDELFFEELQESFLRAIALSPDNIDVDLQICLGVLFHLTSDYEKAAECFQTAVIANPDDPLIWNKLGAALANGGESEKAVDAYHHALTLSPGFVRARYNLGISCYNLKAYNEAIEHFLTALKQQSEGIGPVGTQTQMSDSIWRTLGIAIGQIQRSDLQQCVSKKDLSTLLKEFRIE